MYFYTRLGELLLYSVCLYKVMLASILLSCYEAGCSQCHVITVYILFYGFSFSPHKDDRLSGWLFETVKSPWHFFNNSYQKSSKNNNNTISLKEVCQCKTDIYAIVNLHVKNYFAASPHIKIHRELIDVSFLSYFSDIRNNTFCTDNWDFCVYTSYT